MLPRSTAHRIAAARRVLITLLAVLFLSAPLVEQYFCGSEAAAAELSLSEDADGGSLPVGPDLAHCQHGHCHHLTPMVAAREMSDHIGDTSRKAAWSSPHIESLTPPSLERPPRA